MRDTLALVALAALALGTGGVVGAVVQRGRRTVTGYRGGQPFDFVAEEVGTAGQVLQADAARAFKALQAAAAAAGHVLTVTSAFRTWDEQADLRTRYLAGTGNLAAPPGYSNHQQGLSVDVGGVQSYRTAAYAWLKAHAGTFGFVDDVPGEYWHWTYRGPTSEVA